MISEKTLEKIFLIFLIIMGIYYIFLASQTPFLGDDEYGYFVLGKDFSLGKFPIYVTNVPYDNISYTPTGIFVSLVYSSFFIIFGPSIEISKIISTVFGILTLIFVYLTAKKTNVYYGIFSISLLLSIFYFTHFMFLAYMEIPTAFFSALFFYLLLKTDNLKTSVMTGVVLGLALFTKTSSLIMVGFFSLYLLFQFFYKKNKEYLKFIVITLIVFTLVLAPFTIRNLLLYENPYIPGLNILFGEHKLVEWLQPYITTISPVSMSLDMYISTFGWILIILTIFGFSWLTNQDNKKEWNFLLILFVFTAMFLIVFNLTYVFSITPLETRHFSLLFPQLSLTGGFFLWKLKEKNNMFLLIIIPILFLSITSSITIAQQTSGSQRFPDDHLAAIRWIKTNTPKESFVFTTYGGPLLYYTEPEPRKHVWATSSCLGEEFPNIMTSNNGTYIKNTLRDMCRVSYILIWSPTVASNYIIPESNLWGIYTYNFMNLMLTDTENFLVVYSNENNVVLKLLSEDEKEQILGDTSSIPFT